MLGPKQQAWIDALRSGKYEQGKDFLRRGDSYCCLGVACDLIGCVVEGYDEEGGYLYEGTSATAPDRVVEELRLYSPAGSRKDHVNDFDLTVLNDGGKTFAEIADIIEYDPSRYFREPA